MALINNQPVLPVTVTTGRARYPSLDDLIEPLCGQCQRVLALDATALARKAGTVQAMNVVMLGALSQYIPSQRSISSKPWSRLCRQNIWRPIRGHLHWEKLK